MRQRKSFLKYVQPWHLDVNAGMDREEVERFYNIKKKNFNTVSIIIIIRSTKYNINNNRERERRRRIWNGEKRGERRDKE